MISPDVTLDRTRGIGGSDACDLMAGKWLDLWQRKTGRKPEPNLDHVIAVRIGRYTEALNAVLFQEATGLELRAGVPRMVSANHPFMFGHVDRVVVDPLDGSTTFLECKHTNAQESLRSQAMKYLPQLAHYGIVSGNLERCWLGVLIGNEDYVYGQVDFVPEYLDQLVEMERVFWDHVVNDVEPSDDDPSIVKAVAEANDVALATPIAGLRAYDMAKSNEWAVHAGNYLATEEAAKLFEASKKELKALVPADGAECFGHGVTIKRAKNGNLLIRTEKLPSTEQGDLRV